MLEWLSGEKGGFFIYFISKTVRNFPSPSKLLLLLLFSILNALWCMAVWQKSQLKTINTTRGVLLPFPFLTWTRNNRKEKMRRDCLDFDNILRARVQSKTQSKKCWRNKKTIALFGFLMHFYILRMVMKKVIFEPLIKPESKGFFSLYFKGRKQSFFPSWHL